MFYFTYQILIGRVIFEKISMIGYIFHRNKDLHWYDKKPVINIL